MKRTEAVKNIMIYLLQPEDSTETGGNITSYDSFLLLSRMPWLGVVKGIFWTIAAILLPMVFCMFLFWQA